MWDGTARQLPSALSSSARLKQASLLTAMSTPAPMTVYVAGAPIGQLLDYGPGKVMAFYLTERSRIPLGFFSDRQKARQAVEAQHAGGPEPPRAA